MPQNGRYRYEAADVVAGLLHHAHHTHRMAAGHRHLPKKPHSRCVATGVLTGWVRKDMSESGTSVGNRTRSGDITRLPLQ